MAKTLTVREKRCEECANCQIEKGCMVCYELWGKPCNEIGADECPEDIAIEEVEEIQKKGASAKINIGARADKEKKPRAERKPDVKKEGFIEFLAELLKDNSIADVTITNKSKLIEFTIDGEWYKIDFSYQRNKNKALKGNK